MATLSARIGLAQTDRKSDAKTIEKQISDFIAAEPQLFRELPGGKGSLVLPPEHRLVLHAADFLSQVPVEPKPIDSARYIMDSHPVLEWPPDVGELEKPANPIIIAFFAATRTQPYDGDQTAWCAAFLCWTLEHCGFASPRSAGSKSFREFHHFPLVEDPGIGDIVIFKNRTRPAQGHVAFFDGFANDDKDQIVCLGGNQANSLSRKVFRRRSNSLNLVGFRRPSK
ncbi:hypothetical protein LH464_21870 [Neorhizobium sp. T786]|uniref:hypothetical protein n=1 Tax=Pseudorhizobium xiangyangii TaxID=2883104 RepID=UPI001CFFB54B|nr:hypothetical protein [Neorhizobium xiangyangii]MCB5205119.1 hypothetical protein [Neorhizobium xiangyangii]